MRPILFRSVFFCLFFFLVFTSVAFAAQSVLEKVRDRGYVKCAIGNRPVGDTRIGETGYEGFFPEFCRVVALALFNDRARVRLTKLMQAIRRMKIAMPPRILP